MIEFSERLSYFGIATSLMLYLTKVLQEEMKVAAKNVNYWTSVTTLMPLAGGFLADGYLGRFSTVVCSTVVYLLVSCLLCMLSRPPAGRPALWVDLITSLLARICILRRRPSLTRALSLSSSSSSSFQGLMVLATAQLSPSLKPDRSLRLHETLFFVGIYLVSVGTGGHKPALESFGADQFDESHAAERVQKMSFFNWWNCALCSGVLLGVTVIVYAQDRIGWGAASVVLAAVMAASLLVFLAGWRFYRYRVPEGSPLTPLLQVAVAAFRKRHLALPADAGELYEVKPQNIKKRMLCHTHQLR